MFCWSWHLGGYMMFGKSINITQQTVDDALALVLLAGLRWASLSLVFTDDAIILVHFAFLDDLHLLCFTEKSAPKNFWWCSGCFLQLWQTHTNWQSLTVSSALSRWLICVVLNWTANNKDWNGPKELLLNRSTSLLSY